MSLRTLLFAAALPLVCSGFRWTSLLRDPKAFVECLKLFGRKPGPMGYFNPVYMAFTQQEADNFPNLVSLHSQMRQLKTNGAKLTAGYGTLSLNGKAINGTLRNSERMRTKRDSIYPSTTISDPCTKTIGGQDRLCEVCPAYTDLGPNKIPRYINEVICSPEATACGVGGLFGQCQNTTIMQEFIMIEGFDFEFYTQQIRVCCECGLFPSER